MRIALDLPSTRRTEFAAAADEAGLFGVALRSGSGAETVRAAEVALATRDARIIVEVALGEENPVTLAEELAVLDNITGGRVVALVDTGALTETEALEDVGLLAAALTPRPLRHRGARWQVPAGVNEGVPDALLVSPQPTQVALPLWLSGDAAADVSRELGHPLLATVAAGSLAGVGVQPALAQLSGELEADRALVLEWFDAGATHLIVSPVLGSEPGDLRDYVARYLVPEASMVHFPRLLAEAAIPPLWPGAS